MPKNETRPRCLIDDEDRRFLWLRTPYAKETFESFAPGVDLSGVARRNDEGTLDARFMVDENGLTVEDLRSTNGTYVNAERHDVAHLEPGDEVIIGKFHLVVAGGHG